MFLLDFFFDFINRLSEKHVMESGTSNRARPKSRWQPTNKESNSVTTRESTNSPLDDHDVPGFCRISSRLAMRRRCTLETRIRTKWLISGATQLSMSICTLTRWILFLCFFLSTMQPQAIISAVRVDRGIQMAAGRRPTSRHRGEHSISS